MPKPGRFNNQTWTRPNNEHGRGENEGNIRRVTFKNNRYANNKKGQQKDWSRSIRSHLEEDDVDMSGFNFDDAKNKRFVHSNNRRRGGRQGSPAPQRPGNRSKLIESGHNWYRVNLPYGNKYDKEFVITALSSLVEPTPLIPFLWSTNNTAVSFFLEGHKIAEKLREMDRQIESPDGFKMIIRVNPGIPHTVTITPELKEKMKTAMAGRYNAAGKALDLSNFHTDPNLLDEFCVLIKPEVLLEVIEIMSEIRELEALKLDNNGLKILILLRKLNTNLPNLKILHLAENRIDKIRNLEPLKGSQVVELVLDGNPLCRTCREHSVYISEVRKIFPRLMKLDGVNLEPPIVFDVEEEIPLPTSQQTFLCDPQIQDTVRQFLVEYFNCFDSNDRLKLLPAYHENALFSMTVQYPQGKKETSWLNWYNTDNRNLMRVQDMTRRTKLLKQGNKTIVEFLKEMPTTKHDLNSFTVDVGWSTGFILMTVTGMFKELRRGPPIRYFCRTMVIVPVSGGFCISNEQLHITLASDEQAKLAFKTPIVTPVQSPAQAVNPIAAVSPGSVPVIDNGIKQQMVTAMAQQSGMNLMFSTKCLEEANWDYSQAAIMFSQAHELGKIPPAAFAP